MANKAKLKGTFAENEVVNILKKAGIPAARVIGSGAIKGVGGDIKIGIKLDKDQKELYRKTGELPKRDETAARARGEVKNRKTNPNWLFEEFELGQELNTCGKIVILEPDPQKVITDAVHQSDDATFAFFRRPTRVPKGAVDNDIDKVYIVAMPMGSFVKLFKRAYPKAVIVRETDIETEKDAHR